MSVANNHANDLGRDGLEETPEVLRAAGITPIGEARHDGSPLRAVTLEHRGWKIGLLGDHLAQPRPRPGESQGPGRRREPAETHPGAAGRASPGRPRPRDRAAAPGPGATRAPRARHKSTPRIALRRRGRHPGDWAPPARAPGDRATWGRPRRGTRRAISRSPTRETAFRDPGGAAGAAVTGPVRAAMEGSIRVIRLAPPSRSSPS